MRERGSGVILLAAAFLAAGLVGIATFSVALVSWLTTPGVSPLAQLFAMAWTCTFVATAVCIWRRSRFAAPGFLAAMGLLMVLLSFIFPGGRFVLLPSYVVTLLVASFGYRYLRRASEPAT